MFPIRVRVGRHSAKYTTVLCSILCTILCSIMCGVVRLYTWSAWWEILCACSYSAFIYGIVLCFVIGSNAIFASYCMLWCNWYLNINYCDLCYTWHMTVQFLVWRKAPSCSSENKQVRTHSGASFVINFASLSPASAWPIWVKQCAQKRHKTPSFHFWKQAFREFLISTIV